MFSFLRPSEYLAELQFSFVTFLVGQHYDSFEHWKSLVKLLCQSDDAVLKYPSVFIDFVSDLYFQIKEIPGDFFVDIVTSNNFLFNCMQRLINNIRDHDKAETQLRNKVDRFSSFLTTKFGWDFAEEFDDAPTIVDAADAVLSTERQDDADDTGETFQNDAGDSENDLESESIDMVGDLPTF
jgi:A1 cistron-splicing factor AAR2